MNNAWKPWFVPVFKTPRAFTRDVDRFDENGLDGLINRRTSAGGGA
jgi:hypothetical protein